MNKALKENVTFTAKNGSLVMIAICLIAIGVVGCVIVGAITGCVKIIGGRVLLYSLMIPSLVYLCCLLVYSINMLKAKITIGPDGIMLEGAIDRTKRNFNPFRSDYLKSNLVVDITWHDILHIGYSHPYSPLPLIVGVKIETKEQQRYEMNLSMFSTCVVKEINKYRDKYDI